MSPAQIKGSTGAANRYVTERRVRAIASGGPDDAFRRFNQREDGYIKFILDLAASRP